MQVSGKTDVREAAWIVHVRGMGVRLCIRPNAFGNAIGQGIVGAMQGGSQQEKPLANAVNKGAANGVDLSSATEGRVKSGETRLDFGDPYADDPDSELASSVGAQRRSSRDVLRLSNGTKNGTSEWGNTIEDKLRENIATLSDEVNQRNIAGAIAAGADLAPTVANAANLKLLSSDGSPINFPDSMSPVGMGFGTSAIQGTPQWNDAVGDSRIRLDYYKTSLDAIPETYRLGPEATFDQVYQNAQAASAERNVVLDETRARISQQGLDWSVDLKAKGQPLSYFEDKYTEARGLTKPDANVYRDIIESSGRSNTTVTNTAKALVGIENGLNMVAKPLAVVGAGLDGYSLGTEINHSINTGNWQNTGRESARIAGAWTGAWAGAETGALGGAVIGAWTGPLAPIAVPALTLVGGLGGGIVGYWKGGQAGQNVYNYAHGSR